MNLVVWGGLALALVVALAARPDAFGVLVVVVAVIALLVDRQRWFRWVRRTRVDEDAP